MGTLRSTTNHSRTLVVGGIILGDGLPDGKGWLWQDDAFPDGVVDRRGRIVPDDPEATVEARAVTEADVAFTPLPVRPARYTVETVARPDPMAELSAKVDALTALVVERTTISVTDVETAVEPTKR